MYLIASNGQQGGANLLGLTGCGRDFKVVQGAQEGPEMVLEEEVAGKFPWEVPIFKPPVAPA